MLRLPLQKSVQLTCGAPPEAAVPGALQDRHGLMPPPYLLPSVHSSKTFHRLISFTFPPSLKSIPDGQKLFLNWLCNPSKQLRQHSDNAFSQPGDVLFCTGRPLLLLLGKRPRGWKTEPGFTGTTSSGRETRGPLGILLPPRPTVAPAPFLLGLVLQDSVSQTHGVRADTGSTSRGHWVARQEQRQRWEDPDQRNKTVLFW